jgi:hypothetical protein
MAEMTRTDREELRKVLRAQQKLATEMVDQHAAKLRADGEEQLAKTFSFDDEAFRDLTTAAEAHIRKADKDLAARCTEMGVRPEFRPQLSVSWYSRGENASKERRTELRRVMNTRIDELARAAKVKINARILEGLSLLAADALESSAAKEFLASLPSVEALMPPIDVQALEREADNEKHAGRRPGRLRAID